MEYSRRKSNFRTRRSCSTHSELFIRHQLHRGCSLLPYPLGCQSKTLDAEDTRRAASSLAGLHVMALGVVGDLPRFVRSRAGTVREVEKPETTPEDGASNRHGPTAGTPFLLFRPGSSSIAIYTLRYYLRRFLATMSVTKNAVPFTKATEVKVIDPHTYEVNLVDDWCIGTGKFMV